MSAVKREQTSEHPSIRHLYYESTDKREITAREAAYNKGVEDAAYCLVRDYEAAEAGERDRHLDQLVMRTYWNRNHQFDADAMRTGRCTLGSFRDGCGHRMQWYGLA